MTWVIYPARRAVEHAVTVPGVRPLRLFPVLWPLWQVETSAYVNDEQAYEVIDHFLVRAVEEGGIGSAAELERFFALPPALVQRCLEFLTMIGHVRLDGDRVQLTDLGTGSLRAGIRYVPKESRQTLLFERYTGRPLTRPYYDGGVAVLPTPETTDDQTTDRSRFLRLFAFTPFHHGTVDALAARPDRAEYNVPGQLGGMRVLSWREGFLPAYLVETAQHGLLAYTAVSEERDELLEGVCREVGAVGDLIEAEGLGDPRAIWTEWLAGAGVGTGVPRQLGNGVWRITLSSNSFGDAPKLPVTRIGSFELRKHHFAQVWCEDTALRRRAVRERAFGMTKLRGIDTLDELRGRIARLAQALEVAAPTISELRDHAVRGGADHVVGRLDMLTGSA